MTFEEVFEVLDVFGFWIYIPILMLIAMPMMRYILRMGSDDEDDDDDEESVGSKVIPRRNVSVGRLTGMTMIPKQRREKYGKVVRGLIETGEYDPNIIKQKVKIQSNNNPEPILCPNCGISVMTQWKKCYHCGELL